jgi:hypothetical protein
MGSGFVAWQHIDLVHIYTMNGWTFGPFCDLMDLGMGVFGVAPALGIPTRLA